MIIPLMALCLAVTVSGAQEMRDTVMEGKIDALEKKVGFLKYKGIDVALMEERIASLKRKYREYTETLPMLQEAKTDAERESLSRETGMMRQVIDLTISNLEGEVSVKTASVQRLDILYILASIFGVGFVVGITIYTIWMYMKRR
ncbi:MAG: hypothetical protein JXA20_03495 [Spirochaetes bacterium]|nr:hypothetical protein [Spirochaetota bacterium]